MKNLLKLLGIIALIAMVGFSMVSCSDGGGGGGQATPPREKPPVEPTPPDWSGNWYVYIAPTETTNGILRDARETGEAGEPVYGNVTLYAQGYSNIEITGIDEDGVLVADVDDESVVDVAFISTYDFSGSEKKVFFPAKWIDKEVSAKLIEGAVFTGPEARGIAEGYKTITKIITETFDGADNKTAITEVIFPSDTEVSEIEKNAFQGLTGIVTVFEVPGTVTKFGNEAFEGSGNTTGIFIFNGSKIDIIPGDTFSDLKYGTLIVYGLPNKAFADLKWDGKVWQEADDEAGIAEEKTGTWLGDTTAYSGVVLVRPFR